MKKKLLKFFTVCFFLALFFSKAIAGPTFVQSKSIASAFYLGLNFNNDGTKMYTVRNGGKTDAVIEHILTTPYDISTATENNTKLLHRGGGNTNYIPTQVVFNNDGTKMFISNHTGSYIEYYSLTTAFDISTATFDNQKNISAQEIRANSFAFNNDGTRMIVAGAGNESQHRIHEYSLATPFDLSSTVTHLNTEDLSSTHNYIDGVIFNYNGTKMYTIRNQTNADNHISQFKLTTPYDVSTLSLEGTFDVSSLISGSSDSREMVFSNDGSKMFIIDDGLEQVHEFNLSCNWSVIDGACDDPITTTDGGKDILSSIESQTATAKQIVIPVSYTHLTLPTIQPV